MAVSLHIAVGVLQGDDGRVLVTQRLAGKPGAGQWEFPGGKRHPGESIRQALDRELREELGIAVRQASPLIRLRHRYPDRQVLLDTWCVDAWDGTPHSREGQALRWLPIEALPRAGLLEADRPIVTALHLPTRYAISPPNLPPAHWAAWAGQAGATMLRFRVPGMGDATYWSAWAAAATAAPPGGIWLADRCPDAGRSPPRLGGVHLSQARFASLGPAPCRPGGGWLGVSCHGPADLRRAAAAGADFAVLGPVRPTASHPGAAGLGWQRWARWADAAALPVYAIGGMGRDDVQTARRRGGQGVAGIRLFTPVSDD